MDLEQTKRELTAVCKTAISEYLRSTRGAARAGVMAEVTEPEKNKLLVSMRPADGLYFFEVKVKYTW